MESFRVWIEREKTETETMSCSSTHMHTHTVMTCIHMTLFIWFNLILCIHSRVMCCACATSIRIFVYFVFRSVHCLMLLVLLLFQFCYSKCFFCAVNTTPTGYIPIEYKSYNKKLGWIRGKKASQSNIQTSIIVLQVTPKSESIFLLFMSLLIQLFIQYEVGNQEWEES